MKKIFLLSIFLFIFLLSPSPTRAVCTSTNTCGAAFLSCRDGAGVIYACCDTSGDVCPTVTPTPTPSGPPSDSRCSNPGNQCWSKSWNCPGICPRECGSLCCLDQGACDARTACGNEGTACCHGFAQSPCGGPGSSLTCIDDTCRACGNPVDPDYPADSNHHQPCCRDFGQAPCGLGTGNVCGTDNYCYQNPFTNGCGPCLGDLSNGSVVCQLGNICCPTEEACNNVAAPPWYGQTPNSFCNLQKTRVRTALGCIDATGTATIQTILSWGIGISGGIGLLMIIYSAFLLMTAGGDKKGAQAAKELLMSALIGIAVIGISVVLLNFIGFNVLGLGNFGFITWH